MRRASIAALVAAAFLHVPGPALADQPLRALVAALALACLLAVSLVRPGRAGRAAGVLLGAYAVLYLVSVVLGAPASSLWGVHGRFGGAAATAVFVLAGLTGYAAARRDARFLVRAAAVGLAAQSLVVLWQVTRGDAPTGTIGNSVLAGAWLATLTAVVGAGAVVEKGAERRALAVAALSGALALGLSGSRGAWFGAAAAGLALVMTVPRRRAAGLVAASLAAALVVTAAGLATAAPKLTPRSLVSGSAASRAEIWRSTARMVAANPWTGVGPGRFLFEFPRYETVGHARLEGADVRVDSAHDHALQVAAESGAPAAVALAALAVLASAAGWRAARRGDAAALIALAGFAAYLGQGLFGISAVETDVVGWLLGGVLLASYDASAGSSERPGPGALRRVPQLAAVAAVGLAAVLGAWCLRGEALYARGETLLESGQLALSAEAFSAAVSVDPFSDVSRVGLGDTVLYARPDRERIRAALEAIEAGMALEPRDYDLLLARARLLRLDPGSPSARVEEAYADAVAAYPLGLTVRREAVAAALANGDSRTAERLAEGLRELGASVSTETGGGGGG